VKISYDLTNVPTVRDFMKSDAFIRGLMGPFGSGKSTGCVMEIIRRAHEQAPGPDGIRRTRWAVIRNSFPQLRDTTIKTFHEWVPPSKFGQWKVNDHTFVIDGFKGVEIEVMFRALDRPDQVSNLLSLEVTGAWINEAREIPKVIFEALQGRVGRYPRMADGGATWAGVFMDTNPPDEDSWWYKLFEEDRPLNAEVFKQPSAMGPHGENLNNLRKGYYENLAAGKDPEFIKVYIDGQYGFSMDGRPIYPEYRDATHCKKVEVIPGLPIHRGWDFGLTPACVFSQFSPRGQWRVFKEMVADDMGVDRFSDLVIAESSKFEGHPFIDIGDPAGLQRSQSDEKTCFSILHAKGIMISGGDQDLTARIESVKRPLNTMVDGDPGFMIDPSCRVLRKGFNGGYQYRRLKVSGERFTDTPDKNEYSHPHDALQYTGTRLMMPALTTPKEETRGGRYAMKRMRSWLSA